MKYLIREKREKIGISQSELSRRTGVSRTTIWRLENSDNAVTMTDTLQKLAEVLKCKVEDLFYHQN